MKIIEQDGKHYWATLGKIRQVDPMQEWILKALKFVKTYNSSPIEEREEKWKSASIDSFLLDCSADENGTGYETHLEIIPGDWHSLQEGGFYDKSEDLDIVVTDYIHNFGPIEEVDTVMLTEWLSRNDPKMFEELKRMGLLQRYY
ncbi:hypothetical protein P8R55_05925 [Lactobacillus johnsonii]|uniref:hypothetical protein n=1 Tax=Lactobacillus johnsonii TaxID=33959 RepID=UPI00388F18AA